MTSVGQTTYSSRTEFGHVFFGLTLTKRLQQAKPKYPVFFLKRHWIEAYLSVVLSEDTLSGKHSRHGCVCVCVLPWDDQRKPRICFHASILWVWLSSGWLSHVALPGWTFQILPLAGAQFSWRKVNIFRRFEGRGAFILRVKQSTVTLLGLRDSEGEGTEIE